MKYKKVWMDKYWLLKIIKMIFCKDRPNRWIRIGSIIFLFELFWQSLDKALFS